jgi:hypothetical protein
MGRFTKPSHRFQYEGFPPSEMDVWCKASESEARLTVRSPNAGSCSAHFYGLKAHRGDHPGAPSPIVLEQTMPANAIYVCTVCQKQYTVAETSQNHGWCCNKRLERREIRPASSARRSLLAATPSHVAPNIPNVFRPDPNDPSPSASRSWSRRNAKVLEVIPPRVNVKDVGALVSFVGSLLRSTVFSLEVAGDSDGRQYLVRAQKDDAEHIIRQLEATYDQITINEVPPEMDPARLSDPTQSAMAMAEVSLREPAYLPLRTFKDGEFETSDPMKSLLGTFANFKPGERALAQLILNPSPQGWDDKWRKLAQRLKHPTAANSAQGSPDVLSQLLGLAVTVCMFAWLVPSGIMLFLMKAWLQGAAWFTLGLLGCSAVATFAWLRQVPAGLDPELIELKTKDLCFDASLRLFAVAATPELAAARVRSMFDAYKQLALASGNGLEAEFTSFSPQVLPTPQWPWYDEMRAHVTRFNIPEVVSLWHLPVGPELQMVDRTMVKRLLPPKASLVADGILVGHSVHHSTKIPVCLALDLLYKNTFLVAKTQQGKSTTMTHLTKAAFDEKAAVVVIDPHSDLVRSLARLVPPERVPDVILMDFSNTRLSIGFNLIDVTQGLSPDMLVSIFVSCGKALWKDNWGPRMESILRGGLRTLIAANLKRVQLGEPQFTILDIPALFEMESFRKRILEAYVDDPAVHRYWTGDYEIMPPNLRAEAVNPVLTKIHRFSEHTVVRNIVGQSESTVKMREIVEGRKILLVNTATGQLGEDAGGLLGSVIVWYVNYAVREQIELTDVSQRNKVVIVIDEMQSLPGVPIPALLGELQKMGASFILATQSLSQLRSLDDNMQGAILSNIASLMVFCTSAEDANELRHELDDEVEATDIINLPRHMCYLKTYRGDYHLPTISIETLPPLQGSKAVADDIERQMVRYALPEREVREKRAEFEEFNYGMDQSRRTSLHLVATAEAPAATPTGQIVTERAKPDRKRGHKVKDQTAAAAPSEPDPEGWQPVGPETPIVPGSMPDEDRYPKQYTVHGGGPKRVRDVPDGDPNPNEQPDTLTTKATIVSSDEAKPEEKPKPVDPNQKDPLDGIITVQPKRDSTRKSFK